MAIPLTTDRTRLARHAAGIVAAVSDRARLRARLHDTDVLGPYAPADPSSRSARPRCAMPKAELHLHLDGSLRIETALELARTRRIEAPRDPGRHGRRARRADAAARDQAELLRAFDLPIALMQDAEALERIAAELVEDKAAEGVRYLEIRWGPLLHVSRGLTLEDGIAAVVRGRERGGARATGGAVRLICTALRSHDPAANVRPRRGGLAIPGRGPHRLGSRRSGGAFPGSAHPRARAFEAARAGGLRITVHAGEWGGAAQVRRALVDGTGADRPRRQAPSTTRRSCAELRSRARCLDLCPTSNVQAGIVPSVAAPPAGAPPPGGRARHPLDRRHDRVATSHAHRRSTGGRVERIGLTLAGALGDRSIRPRRRVRRRGDARSDSARVRGLGRRVPRAVRGELHPRTSR